MSGHIRIVAHRQDPVDINRLVRLLIAQAQLELKKQQTKEEVEQAKRAAAPQEQAS
ncbi:MAG: hypothetical protein LC749_04635 [Actinobacteria bacterium]|nr:hypothetical protein [Actinomycetota bacterium]